jgi:hypothetical protein
LEGGVIVKKFNPYETYSLGKQLFPVLNFAEKDYNYSEIMWPLYMARMTLLAQIKTSTVFQSASNRAAGSAIGAINSVISENIDEMIKVENDKKVTQYEIHNIKNHIQNLETVLSNDMPGVSAYVVSQKGIYKTDDLISHADHNFPKEIRKDIPEQAIKDLIESGKCLAFEVPTACAFHLWRAVETVMGAYYQKLTKSTFDSDGVHKNWGAYSKALVEKGADSNITKFLDHIRESYRNPQTHPEAMLEVNEALGLFGVATSAIQMMILEIQKP